MSNSGDLFQELGYVHTANITYDMVESKLFVWVVAAFAKATDSRKETQVSIYCYPESVSPQYTECG